MRSRSCGAWTRLPSWLRAGKGVAYKQGMPFLRQHTFTLIFLGLLVFCSVMVIRQMQANRTRHAELLDAFILLHSRGYTNQAQRLYQRLLNELDRLPAQTLYDDFQRTLMVVNPTQDQPQNPVWKYHWTVSNEMEKRSERNLVRALKIAAEED